MTQLRKFRDSISNYFDQLVDGIGKRGSTFMDMDAVSHDKDTGRFLFQEFKERNEYVNPAVETLLRDLAALDRCTVWLVRRMGYGRLTWKTYHPGAPIAEEHISEDEYKARIRRWWDNRETPQYTTDGQPAVNWRQR